MHYYACYGCGIYIYNNIYIINIIKYTNVLLVLEEYIYYVYY